MPKLLLALAMAGMGALCGVPSLVWAADLETIQARGQLIVAVKDNLRPLGFRDRAGQLQGFEIAIARQLAQELLGDAAKVELRPTANVDRLQVVIAGDVDLAIARVTATEVRSRVVVFSFPYYLDGTMLVTRDPELQRATDLAQQKVAVLDGSSTIAILRYRLPTAQLVGVSSYQAAYELLERGEALAFAGDATVLSGWVQEYPQYRLLSPPLSVEPLSIVMPKGLAYEPLRRRINAIVSRWHETGWLRSEAARWGLPTIGF